MNLILPFTSLALTNRVHGGIGGGSSPAALTWDVTGNELVVAGTQLTRITSTSHTQHGGAVSRAGLVSNNGSIVAVHTDITKEWSICIGNQETPPHVYTSRYGILANFGNVRVMDKGPADSPFGYGGLSAIITTVVNNDTLGIVKVGNTLTAQKNGIDIYTYVNPVYGPLRAMAYVHDIGYSINPTILGSWIVAPLVTTWPTFTDVGSDIQQLELHSFCRIVGGTIDTTGAAWASENILNENGSLFMYANNQGMGTGWFGLTSSASKVDFTGLKYSILVDSSCTARVYENGSLVHTGPAYVQGDLMEIRVAAGGTVSYHLNGDAAFFTSSLSATGLTLHPDLFIFSASWNSDVPSTLEPFLSSGW